MKTLGLVLALLIIAAGVSIADTVSYDVYTGWNLIAAPLVPYNPDPASVFAGNTINNYLIRNDPVTGQVPYKTSNPADFGSVLLGDGFWLRKSANGVVSYSGVPDGVPSDLANPTTTMTDMWISLPGAGSGIGGWHLIGCPYNHDVAVNAGGLYNGDNVMFTDGTNLKNWSDAKNAGWVQAKMTGSDPLSGGNFYVTYQNTPDSHTIQTAHGYWIRTYKDNLAIILPAYPTP